MLKNADISIFSDFLARFINFFLDIENFLPRTIYMTNFRSIGSFKQKLQRGTESALPWPYQSAKSPACFGLTQILESTLNQGEKGFHFWDIGFKKI